MSLLEGIPAPERIAVIRNPSLTSTIAAAAGSPWALRDLASSAHGLGAAAYRHSGRRHRAGSAPPTIGKDLPFNAPEEFYCLRLLAADGRLRKFEIVVSGPPFSLRDWGYEGAELDIHQRYWRGVPPRAAGDYAFISHMVETLKPETGCMAAVVSLGVLFRGAAERQIRERLIEENLIDAVIALPTKMFPHTGIPVAILVVRKDKIDDNVLFIDASRSYHHGKTQNVLGLEDLDLIEKTYCARHNVNRYARLVTRAEIVSNDSNLSVARYVDATEVEPEVDLSALRTERAQLKAELANLEANLAALLEGIGYA